MSTLKDCEGGVLFGLGRAHCFFKADPGIVWSAVHAAFHLPVSDIVSNLRLAVVAGLRPGALVTWHNVRQAERLLVGVHGFGVLHELDDLLEGDNEDVVLGQEPVDELEKPLPPLSSVEPSFVQEHGERSPVVLVELLEVSPGY